MFDRLKGLFRTASTTLTAVDGPTAVRLRARVASPKSIRSPMTGLSASFFHIDFQVEVSVEGGMSRGGTDRTFYQHIGSAVVGGDLILESEGQLIFLPASRFVVRFRGAHSQGQPVQRSLPAEMAHIANAPACARGPLFYNELSLSTGEDVQLVATVKATRGGVGYRDQPEASTPFIACPEVAPVVVHYSFPSIG
jgi:hypothetical protein